MKARTKLRCAADRFHFRVLLQHLVAHFATPVAVHHLSGEKELLDLLLRKSWLIGRSNKACASQTRPWQELAYASEKGVHTWECPPLNHANKSIP